jgi:MoaA/NifB/PqqE/SkfB family radical SAM enzyme
MMAREDVSEADWADVRRTLSVVECELNTDCNRSCVYCPQSIGALPATPNRMPDEVLGLLLGDLERIDFAGRFSHHLYGEPLLDPRLVLRVREIRTALPRAVQVLFSNGDLLTDETHAHLLDAGIALVAITRHQSGPYPERSQQVVQYAKELQFTSRGGSIPFLLKKKRLALDAIRQRPCHAPDEMLIVGWDGAVLRCYEDARRGGPLGDLRTHTLGAIWSRSRQLRDALRRGARAEAGDPCASCDNVTRAARGD